MSKKSEAAKTNVEKAGRQDVSIQDVSLNKAVWRTFPGPRGAQAQCKLRVAFERIAFAEVNAHAKESLDVEICGILAGQVCEDDEGTFLHVEAAVRGTAATQASASVTFTQETWNAIYAVLERDYPKLRIVGWYHTHPGFGVEFSSMDLFVHQNLFPAPTQVAMVTDPVNGLVAMLMNAGEGVEYISQFWVDGREHRGAVPASAVGADSSASAGGGNLERSIQILETRLNQVLQSVEEQRTMFYRVLFTVGLVFCVAIVAVVANTVYQQFQSRVEPPRVTSYVPVPVQIGDRTALIGVGVVDWTVPDEVNAMLVKAAQLKREEENRQDKTGASSDKEKIPDGLPSPQVAPPHSAKESSSAAAQN